jgi:hypothetical protein
MKPIDTLTVAGVVDGDGDDVGGVEDGRGGVVDDETVLVVRMP